MGGPNQVHIKISYILFTLLAEHSNDEISRSVSSQLQDSTEPINSETYAEDCLEKPSHLNKTSNNQSSYTKQSKYLKAVTCALCTKVFETPRKCIDHYDSVHHFSLQDKIKRASKRQLTRLNSTNSIPEKSSNPHLRSHQNSKPCPICQKYFLNKNLEMHISSYHFHYQIQKQKINKQTCLCSHCGKHFSYISTLNSHIQSVHIENKTKTKPSANRTFLCEKCPFKTSCNRRLRDHIKGKHEHTLPYSCKHCSYQTWELSSIRDHVYRHRDRKRFACQYCDYQCIQKKQLRRHLLKHGIQLPKIGNQKQETSSEKQTASLSDDHMLHYIKSARSRTGYVVKIDDKVKNPKHAEGIDSGDNKKSDTDAAVVTVMQLVEKEEFTYLPPIDCMKNSTIANKCL